jgi:rhodanese-related sulfurtransferase
MHLRPCFRVGILAFIVLGASCNSREIANAKADDTHDVARLGGNLIEAATKIARPEYPAASVKRRSSGLAVAEVMFDTAGHPQLVTVIEAPDDEIRQAVATAINHWEFKQITARNRELKGSGTVTFRFVLDPAPHVLTQKEMSAGIRSPATIIQPTKDTGLIDAVETNRLIRTKNASVIDIRSRASCDEGYVSGATCIPLTDLAGRAPVELPAGKPIVISCYVSGDCDFARRVLLQLGFREVFIHRE